MRSSVAAAFLLGARLIAAAPLSSSSTGCASEGSDPAFTVPCQTLAASVKCPNGISGAKNGIVLLVHGTGSTGEESWAQGPYVQLLPKRALVDVCWVNLPNRSLSDAQVSAEYVAYNIRALAAKSKTGKVSIIGHSQGAGINPQWALLYWPQTTRKYVQDYVSLAGDFHGTGEGSLLCAAPAVSPCAPSVYQVRFQCAQSSSEYDKQSIGSNYLAAQNKRGNTDLLNGRTTSIYTILDDVIQPEGAPGTLPSRLPPPLVTPTSALGNTATFALQDPQICGATHVADHFSMIIDPGAYALAVDALLNKGAASASRFNKVSCTYLEDNVLASNYKALPAFVKGIVLDVLAVGIGGQPRSTTEPKLMPYVCAAGDAPASQCS